MRRSEAPELLTLLSTRRSVRAFSSEPVSAELEEQLLAAARAAPSAGNAQCWYFVRVRARSLRQELSRAALSQRFVATAPLVIVVCADQARAEQAYGERGLSLYCLQDTAAATQNLLLAAHAMGLGACWVGAFDEREVSQALSLPAHLRPVALVTVGVPAQQPRAPSRRPLDEVSSSHH